MNIKDFEADEFNKDTWLDVMYEKQKGVALKYEDIEGLPRFPLRPEPKESQVVFKKFLYRVSEELAESYETEVDPSTKVYDDENPEVELHAIEELADALHFFLEMLIYMGIGPEALKEWHKEYQYNEVPVDKAYLMAFFRIGMVGNQLHNKPWKTSSVPVDTKVLRQKVKDLFYAILDVFRSRGASDEDIFNFYTRKNKVNQFRIKSKY